MEEIVTVDASGKARDGQMPSAKGSTCRIRLGAQNGRSHPLRHERRFSPFPPGYGGREGFDPDWRWASDEVPGGKDLI